MLSERTVVTGHAWPWFVARAPTPSPTEPARPPFDAPAARRIRAALGIGPEHVAHDRRVSYGLPHVTPDNGRIVEHFWARVEGAS